MLLTTVAVAFQKTAPIPTCLILNQAIENPISVYYNVITATDEKLYGSD